MIAISRRPDRRQLRLGLRPGCVAFIMLIIGWGSIGGWGCAGHGLATHTDPPDWLNSVLTAQAPIVMTPSMSVADRLTELRRAKEAARQQLVDQVLSLRIKELGTIAEMAAARPQLRQDIESYVTRVEVVDVDQRGATAEVRSRIELDADLLDLLHVKTTPAPVDRSTPSTGIVHPTS
ncbi:MAG TPA: hypothetical protein VML36_03725 [Nitrospiria bacterium]|nr:hypothetical protein [Nitrospiria bacterium]